MHDRSRHQFDDTPKNSHYEDDIHYALEMCQWFLKPIGIWSQVYSRTSRVQKIVSNGLLVWCSLFMLINLTPPSRNIIFDERNTYKRMKLLGPLLFSFTTMVKYYYLAHKGPIFRRCIVQVERDWRTVEESSHRAIMLRQVSTSRNLISLCAIFLYTGGMFYYTLMPFLSKSRFRGNTTIRLLIYPGYDAFVNTQSSPNYEIIFSIQCILGLFKYNITTSAYSLTAIFITHISGQIQIQIARLQGIVGKEHEKNHDPLAIIIRDHVEILRFSKNVEEALREICLALILESTLVICLLEYYLLMEWENSDAVVMITYFIFLTSFTFNILIFCYIGEILTGQCSQIGPASYDIDWYNLPPKQAYNLIMLNAISLYPPKLTAGKMVPLSMCTFSSVMQTSVVYLNLLRTVTD